MTQHITPSLQGGVLSAQGQYVGPYQFRGHTLDLRQNTQRLSIRGVFSGTIQVLVVDPGIDQTVSTNQFVAATYTTPTSQVFEAGGNCDIYFYSSVWSSGSATCTVWY